MSELRLDLTVSESFNVTAVSVRDHVVLPRDDVRDGKLVSILNTGTVPFRVVDHTTDNVVLILNASEKRRFRFSAGTWVVTEVATKPSLNLQAAANVACGPHRRRKPKKPCHHHHHHHHHNNDCKDGRDGRDGRDGKNGKDGRNGKDGKNGKDGRNGKDGKSCCVREICCTFTDAGTWQLPLVDMAGNPLKCETNITVLVVAGGGAGAPGSSQRLESELYPGGGGGGCGEFHTFFICAKHPATDDFSVTVGAGGVGATPGNTSTDGGDSYVTYNGKPYAPARGGKAGVSLIGGTGYPYNGGNAKAPVADNGQGTDAGLGGATVDSSMGGGGGASTSYGSPNHQSGGNGGSNPTKPVQGYAGGGGGGGYGDAELPSAGANGGDGLVIVTYSYVEEECEPEPPCPCPDPCKPDPPCPCPDPCKPYQAADEGSEPDAEDDSCSKAQAADEVTESV